MIKLIFVVIAAVSNSIMDKIAFHWYGSIFNRPGFWTRYAGPDSWQNKYNISQYPFILWIFKGPLVFMTDFWHLMQMVVFTAYQIPLVLHMPILIEDHIWINRAIWLLIIKIIHWAFFELFFTKILSKKARVNT